MESYPVQNYLQKLLCSARRSQCFYLFIFLSLYAFYLIMENYVFRSQNTGIYDFNNGIPHNCSTKVYVFPSRQWKKSKEKKILLWTTFEGKAYWQNEIEIILKSDCNQPCSVASDKALVAESDAVIFHINDLPYQKRLPTYRALHQVWVAFTAEALPLIYNVITDKSLLLTFPSWVFNWTLSFRTDATVYAPYGHTEAVDSLESPEARINLSKNFGKTKTKMVYTIISNCEDNAGRLEYVKRLQQLTSLDFYGRCGNLKCNSDACEKMLPAYRFAVVFENSNCKDYVTEKFWNALYRTNVPVVNWVPGQAPSDAPPNSFINIHDFESVKELAIYLTNLSSNDSEYNKYFEWKKTHKIVHGTKIWNMFCYLCKALHNNSIPAQGVHFRRWYTDDICKLD